MSPDDVQDFDSFWKITRNLSEASQRLETPFRRALERSQSLENELHQIHTRLNETETKLKETQETLRLQGSELEHRKNEEQELLRRLWALEEHKTSLISERDRLAALLKEENRNAVQLTAALESARHTQLKQETRIHELTEALTRYQTHCQSLIQHDQQMRQQVWQMKLAQDQQQEELKTAFQAEKVRLLGQIEDFKAQAAHLQEEVENSRQTLDTEKAAHVRTSEALNQYQLGWNKLVAGDQNVRQQITRLQNEWKQAQARGATLAAELAQYKSVVERYGPIQDHELLRRQTTAQQEEITRLRKEILAQAGLQQQLESARAETESLKADLAAEASRFREVAAQDQQTKTALWEKLTAAEKLISELQQH